MNVLTFDTHKAVTALKQAGCDETQAEAGANTMGLTRAAIAMQEIINVHT